MKVVLALAALVALSSAIRFESNTNRNWRVDSNWVGGQLPSNAHVVLPTLDSWGSGGPGFYLGRTDAEQLAAKLVGQVTPLQENLCSLTLPDNGELILDNDLVIELADCTPQAPVVTFRDLEVWETDVKCHHRWSVVNEDSSVVPNVESKVPCFEDSIFISENSASALVVGPDTYVSQIIFGDTLIDTPEGFTKAANPFQITDHFGFKFDPLECGSLGCDRFCRTTCPQFLSEEDKLDLAQQQLSDAEAELAELRRQNEAAAAPVEFPVVFEWGSPDVLSRTERDLTKDASVKDQAEQILLQVVEAYADGVEPNPECFLTDKFTCTVKITTATSARPAFETATVPLIHDLVGPLIRTLFTVIDKETAADEAAQAAQLGAYRFLIETGEAFTAANGALSPAQLESLATMLQTHLSVQTTKPARVQSASLLGNVLAINIVRVPGFPTDSATILAALTTTSVFSFNGAPIVDAGAGTPVTPESVVTKTSTCTHGPLAADVRSQLVSVAALNQMVEDHIVNTFGVDAAALFTVAASLDGLGRRRAVDDITAVVVGDASGLAPVADDFMSSFVYNNTGVTGSSGSSTTVGPDGSGELDDAAADANDDLQAAIDMLASQTTGAANPCGPPGARGTAHYRFNMSVDGALDFADASGEYGVLIKGHAAEFVAQQIPDNFQLAFDHISNHIAINTPIAAACISFVTPEIVAILQGDADPLAFLAADDTQRAEYVLDHMTIAAPALALAATSWTEVDAGAAFGAAVGTAYKIPAVKNLVERSLHEQTIEAQRAQFASAVNSLTPAPNGPSGARSSSSSGLPIIPIVAAIGGVVLIAIIVAVVVLRRGGEDALQRSSSRKKAAADRTVVAFENPMYDDPGTDPYADQTTYDQATGEDEGLYDEPAFNADKSNPVYDSAEDLTYDNADNEDEEGGYLDVSPDDM